jgi:methylenetetrahydrofolate dehydrogenase (NADP+)/methenyltetrahydrofolate cyclohydrolase
MAVIIDGKATAKTIRREIREEVRRLRAEGITPGLAAVLVGEDPASQVYVRSKEKACERAGIYSEVHRLPKQTTQEELERLVRDLNSRADIDGILVQLPLPEGLDEQRVIHVIDPDKDVDGFHSVNLGRIMLGLPGFVPATPLGIVELLKRYEISTRGREVVIVGRSHIVGKPLANLLLGKGMFADATVTVCHSRTADLAAVTRRGDILVAALGRPLAIGAEMIKPGAVVIDVGVNRIADPGTEKGYRLVGDVDFAAVKDKTAAITPVPGGVGPMTIAMLLHNTVLAARRRRERRS